ncbi:hypothetical protein C5167_038286 [Papaver somniferum]|uniref:Uncharacterized protein n=1 Tax=Papaver somniferum TaxID=3469 RepID=A0A4Y7ICX2_PAPSO|nr:hypothetical protein C5167_038286 [Papaver somniferum]
MVKGKMNPPRKDDTITGNLRQSLNAVKDLVKVIKPIGLTDRAHRYLRRAAYGELVMMYYDDYDTTRIGSRKGQKLLKYYCPSDLTDNVLYIKYFTDIKSTKHQTTVTKTNILEKIKQLMAKRRKSGKRKKVDEKDLVCLIGLYLCCVLFFGDKNANGVNAKYLSIVETYDTVLKVSWPDLIHEHLFEEIHTNLSCLSNVKACVQYLLLLFVEHTPAGLIPKVENHEEDIPRVGRWDIYQISDYIWKTDMTQFSPTPSFVAEFSQLEKQLGISTVVPSKDDLQS